MTAAHAAQLAVSMLILIVNAAQLRVMRDRSRIPQGDPYRPATGQATGPGSVPPRRWETHMHTCTRN